MFSGLHGKFDFCFRKYVSNAVVFATHDTCCHFCLRYGRNGEQQCLSLIHIYGSPKVAAYHRKSLDLPTNFSIVNSAAEAVHNRLSVVNCTDDEVKVEFSKADPEAGKAALGALERAIEEYKEGLVDVIVTAPINKHTIQSETFAFPGHTEYIDCLLYTSRCV